MATNNAVNLASPGIVTYDGAGVFSADTVTNHGILVGAASNAITSKVLTDGQLLIGNTGNDPTAAVPTSGIGASVAGNSGGLTINVKAFACNGAVVAGATQVLPSVGGTYFYIASNAAPVAFSLPGTVNQFGMGFIITSRAAGAGWTITQSNAAHQIFFGDKATTLGAGGSLSSTSVYDVVQIISVGNFIYQVIASIGNITVV